MPKPERHTDDEYVSTDFIEHEGRKVYGLMAGRYWYSGTQARANGSPRRWP